MCVWKKLLCFDLIPTKISWKKRWIIESITFFYCGTSKQKTPKSFFFLNVWQYLLNSWSDRFVDNEKRIFKCPNIVNGIFFHSTTWWSIRTSTICIQLGVLFIFNLTCFFNDLKCNNDWVTNVRWGSFKLLFFFFGFCGASQRINERTLVLNFVLSSFHIVYFWINVFRHRPTPFKI